MRTRDAARAEREQDLLHLLHVDPVDIGPELGHVWLEIGVNGLQRQLGARELVLRSHRRELVLHVSRRTSSFS